MRASASLLTRLQQAPDGYSPGPERGDSGFVPGLHSPLEWICSSSLATPNCHYSNTHTASLQLVLVPQLFRRPFWQVCVCVCKLLLTDLDGFLQGVWHTVSTLTPDDFLQLCFQNDHPHGCYILKMVADQILIFHISMGTFASSIFSTLTPSS